MKYWGEIPDQTKLPLLEFFPHWMNPMKHPQLFCVLMDRPPLCLNPIGRCLTGSSSLEWIPFAATSRLDAAQLDKTIADFRFAQLQCKVSSIYDPTFIHITIITDISCRNLHTFHGAYCDYTEIQQATCFFLYFSPPPLSYGQPQ